MNRVAFVTVSASCLAACAHTDGPELDCNLTLNEIATITADGPNGPSPESTVKIINGRFFVAPTFNPGEISVFNADGTHAYSFGKFGSGPAENREIEAIEVRADTVFVHDPVGGRISAYTASGEYVGTAVPLHSYSPFTVLRNGDFAMVPNSQSEDLAIVEIRRADQVLASFTVPHTASSGVKVNAILADADSGNVWFAIRFIDLIERYSPSGQVLSRITTGEAALLKDRDYKVADAHPDSVASIADITVDPMGHLFTLVSASAIPARSTEGGAEQAVPRVRELRSFKAVIRVFEPETGRLLAQHVQPESYLRGFADARHVYAEGELSDGTPLLKVYRMHFEDVPGGATCAVTMN